MRLVPLLFLLPLVIESMVLDNREFLISSSGKYSNARLPQFGTGGFDVGTYGGKIYDDQIWTLKPSNKAGCYYIVNKAHSQYRIADSKHKVVVWKGRYYDDQLFRFNRDSNPLDETYMITSCHYPADRLTKNGPGDRDIFFLTATAGRRYGSNERWEWVLKTPENEIKSSEINWWT
jgi:hypothetical protein